MRDLAVQASNAGANDANSQAALQTEADALATELGRIAGKTSFNGVNLLDGKYGDGVSTGAGTSTGVFQVGYASNDTITVSIKSAGAGATAKGFTAADLAVGTATTANSLTGATAITDLDTAIKSVSTARANLGALQNRFEHVVSSVNISMENLSASESRIRDTDMAQEMTAFTRSQILTQAGTAMLAQANQGPQGVLALLRG
jgi:flagellin